MTDFGLVSIITPTWNCGSFILDAINSVHNQTYTEWEMLIQDDCSDDDTQLVVAEYAAHDARVKYERNDVRCGAAITRNHAIRRAKGRWIAFLDGDDLWLPEKLECQLTFMVNNGYAFTYHNYSEISEDGHDLGVLVSGKRKVSKFDMFSCCWPGCLSVMYDVEKIGIVQIKDVQKNNDTALWLKVIRFSQCYLLNVHLAKYRRREVSLTPNSLWKRVWAHYPLFRIAEEMNPMKAIFWTFMNVAGNGIKKVFYVRKISTEKKCAKL